MAASGAGLRQPADDEAYQAIFPAVVDAGLLSFIRHGRALRTEKAGVQELARTLIPVAEIVPLFGIRPDAVWARMWNHSSVPSMPGGWSRPTFQAMFGGLEMTTMRPRSSVSDMAAG